MKKLITGILLLVLVMLAACVSAPAPVVEEPEKKEEQRNVWKPLQARPYFSSAELDVSIVTMNVGPLPDPWVILVKLIYFDDDGERVHFDGQIWLCRVEIWDGESPNIPSEQALYEYGSEWVYDRLLFPEVLTSFKQYNESDAPESVAFSLMTRSEDCFVIPSNLIKPGEGDTITIRAIIHDKSPGNDLGNHFEGWSRYSYVEAVLEKTW